MLKTGGSGKKIIILHSKDLQPCITITILSYFSMKVFTGVQIYKLRHFCLFDLILYVPSTIFQLNRDGSSWVEPVLS